ncbi:7102_t:CDS:10 [Funneliformis geosporum]|nr:7102_t:CDS:10 [Funneliformis geosporum]
MTETIIQQLTQEGDLVVDPCAGSFVSLRACQSLKRNFLGTDLTLRELMKFNINKERTAAVITEVIIVKVAERIAININDLRMEANNLRVVQVIRKCLDEDGAIQDKIPSLIKSKTNTHQNYKYFEEHQILKILKPLLKENKLTMIITDDDSQPQQYEREGNKHFLRYLKQMEISDRETGETKAKGSAETYAIKYMLSKFFQIRVMDKNEPDLKGDIKAVNPAEAEKKIVMERELENNQDIELKTAPEYVVGYLIEELRNKDLSLVAKKKVLGVVKDYLQNDCTGKCLDFIRDHDFKYYETEEVLKEIGKIEYTKAKIIEKKNDEELAKIEKENLKKLKEQEEKNQKEFENLSKETSKNQDTIDSPAPTNNDDDNWKKKFVGDIEMDLIKKNISQERLSKRLGVNIISKLEYEYTCANCGVKKEENTFYGVGVKKACSYDCQKALKGEDKGVNKDEAKEIKKELQEIKDYLKNHNENANKRGVVNITLSSDKLVVEFSGKKTKIMEESELNSEHRVVKNYLQGTSGKKSIDRSELEKMVSGYNEQGGDKPSKDGKVGIIVAIVAVGLILAFVIGAVVYGRNKKRDY